MTCKALAERYSRHLGRSLDAMKEVRPPHNSPDSHATTGDHGMKSRSLLAPGGCDGGRHQCLVPGHAGPSRDILETYLFSDKVLSGNFTCLGHEAALARPGAGREIVALEPFFELYRSQAMMISGAFMSAALQWKVRNSSRHCIEGM